MRAKPNNNNRRALRGSAAHGLSACRAWKDVGRLSPSAFWVDISRPSAARQVEGRCGAKPASVPPILRDPELSCLEARSPGLEIQGARACSEHEHEHGEHARTCSGSADLQNPVLGLARARPCSKIPRARLCSCSADLKMPCSGSLLLPSTKLTYYFNIFELRIQRLSLSS